MEECLLSTDQIEAKKLQRIEYEKKGKCARKCVFPKCTPQLRMAEEHISFHRFPSQSWNADIRTKWINVVRDALQNLEWTPAADTICSRHFLQGVIRHNKEKSYLNYRGVPYINIDNQSTPPPPIFSNVIEQAEIVSDTDVAPVSTFTKNVAQPTTFFVCLVPDCTKSLRDKEENLLWHWFPKSTDQLTESFQFRIRNWTVVLRKALNDRSWKPLPNARICSRHFKPMCYITDKHSGKKLLLARAIPTMFLNGKEEENNKKQTAIPKPVLDSNELRDPLSTFGWAPPTALPHPEPTSIGIDTFGFGGSDDNEEQPTSFQSALDSYELCDPLSTEGNQQCRPNAVAKPTRVDKEYLDHVAGEEEIHMDWKLAEPLKTDSLRIYKPNNNLVHNAGTDSIETDSLTIHKPKPPGESPENNASSNKFVTGMPNLEKPTVIDKSRPIRTTRTEKTGIKKSVIKKPGMLALCPNCKTDIPLKLPAGCSVKRSKSTPRHLGDDTNITPNIPNSGTPLRQFDKGVLLEEHNYYQCPKKVAKVAEVETAKSRIYEKKNRLLRKQLKTREGTIKNMKLKLEKTTKNLEEVTKLLETAKKIESKSNTRHEKLPPMLKELIENECQAIRIRGTTGMCYSDEVKKFAGQIYSYSPRALNFIRTQMTLPSSTTLERISKMSKT